MSNKKKKSGWQLSVAAPLVVSAPCLLTIIPQWAGWVCVISIKTWAKNLTEDAQADFFTTDYNELLKRPEVNATIISTDENLHVGPTLAAVEQGHTYLLKNRWQPMPENR